MEIKKLSPQIRTVWLLGGILSALILAALAAAVTVLVEEPHRKALGIIVGTPWLILTAWLLLYPLLRYRCSAYGYNERRILLRHGVIFRHEIVIPVCQLQDLHRFVGPVMRLFGLSSLILSTGGSNFHLIGLEKQDAEEMLNALETCLNRRIEEKRHDELH